MTPFPLDQTERRRLIREAAKTRNMGSTLEVENRTNPVCEYRCVRLDCDHRLFQRRFAASGAWPYCCQQMMVYLGAVTK